MQLQKLKFWNKSNFEDKPHNPNLPDEPSTQSENVIHLNVDNPLDQPAGKSDEFPLSDSSYVSIRKDISRIGVMSCEEITQFFTRNFVNCGRYAGSTTRTQDALDLGIKTIIAQFQNTLSMVIDQQQAKIDGLKNIEAQTVGLSSSIQSQLGLRREKYDRDLLTLKEQRDLAEEQKGWVLSAVNEYRIGFDRGLREAIDAEILGL